MENVNVRRPHMTGEELANTISHGVGALLAVVGAVPLLARAATAGSVEAVVGMSLYAVSLITLYTASTVYHGTVDPEKKRQRRMYPCPGLPD